MLALDSSAFAALNASASTPAWVVGFARFLSLQLPLLATGLIAGIALSGSSKDRNMVMRAVASLIAAMVLARLLRAGLQVPRPAALGLGTQWIEHGPSAGFPSMHATGAFALASALIFCRRWPWPLAAFALAFAVAWSRISLGVHFPSDVLAGAICGLLGGWMSAYAFGISDGPKERAGILTPAPAHSNLEPGGLDARKSL